jgi:hypothetical protein
VPLIVTRGSDCVDNVMVGQQSDALVSLVDLFQTIGELAGVSFPLSPQNPCNLSCTSCDCMSPPCNTWTCDSVSFRHILEGTGTQSLRDFALVEQFWPNNWSGGLRTQVPEWCESATFYRRAVIHVDNGVLYRLIVQTGVPDPGHLIGIPACNEGQEFFDIGLNPYERNCAGAPCTASPTPCGSGCMTQDQETALCDMWNQLNTWLIHN